MGQLEHKKPLLLHLVHTEAPIEGAKTVATKKPKHNIRLATIFIDQAERQCWIDKRVQALWTNERTAIMRTLHDANDRTHRDLAFQRTIAHAFLASYKIQDHEALNNLMDLIALFTVRAYQAIGHETQSVRKAHYNLAYSSTSFFEKVTGQLAPPKLKSINELRLVIAHQDVDLGTSVFEKELTTSISSTTEKLTEKNRYLSPEQWQRFILILFTAFNQRKTVHLQ